MLEKIDKIVMPDPRIYIELAIRPGEVVACG
jgi:hypothetical protein